MLGTRLGRRLGLGPACAAVLVLLGVGGVSVGLAATPQPASANLKVGTCNNATYSTIQAAVNAASSGATIVVCPGTYIEQVTIPAGKNNLTLRSKKPHKAIIQAPPGMSSPKVIVRVNGATGVSILRFTIRGPGDGPLDSLEDGVRVDSGGSATISGNHITHIRDSPFGGSQNGRAVRVEGASSATITDNTIDDYQKGGISVANVGSSADVERNTVTGLGPTGVIAQNGIAIFDSASGTVKNNDASRNSYTGNNNSVAGILIFQAVSATVQANTVHDNEIGVWAFDVDGGTQISGNIASGSEFEGIALQNSSGGSITGNKSFDNQIGVALENTANGVAKANDAHANDVGMFADSSSATNTITENSAHDNGTFDCEDDSTGGGTAGTDNTWTGNHGHPNSPEGICDPTK